MRVRSLKSNPFGMPLCRRLLWWYWGT